MKTILIAIANYGNSQEKYLKEILKEFNSFKKYNISIILLNTKRLVNLNYPKLKIRQKIYDISIKDDLPHQHKDYFFKEKNNFDLFLYTENDILIKEINIDSFLDESRNLIGTNFIPGFIGYEKNNLGDIFLDNLTPNQGGATRHNIIYFLSHLLPKNIFKKIYSKFEKDFIIKKIWKINGKDYFEPQNTHQACYLVTKSQLKLNLFPNRKKIKRNMFCSPKVTAASFPYFKHVSGLIKIIPVKRFENFLIHHLPNKYIIKFNQGFPLKNFKKLLK